MNMATFDARAAVNALAGVATEHAEAITETVRIAVSEGVATKADIDNVGARMDRRVAEFGARFDRRFAEFERRMLKLAVFIVPAQPALTVGLLMLFGGAP